MFIEILWRGHSHWSMGIAGGISLLIIYFIEKFLYNKSIVLKAALSAICITVIELLIGLFVNIHLKLYVWDYSGIPFNFLGQVSLIYSIYWFLLCMPALLLCKIIRHRIFGVPPNSSRLITKIFERRLNSGKEENELPESE